MDAFFLVICANMALRLGGYSQRHCEPCATVYSCALCCMTAHVHRIATIALLTAAEKCEPCISGMILTGFYSLLVFLFCGSVSGKCKAGHGAVDR